MKSKVISFVLYMYKGNKTAKGLSWSRSKSKLLAMIE